ncbi:MAG: uroporphyrinogen decarboxylase [Proteobacteria bacterium]|nr:uroporphyrinogen decarboxylase [Pseudomonadota bacterium]
MGKLLLRALKREAVARPPMWLMRQAGRYLPEYLETRKQAGDFLNLCYTPALATEVTLQPIRRFGFDAAILFSDILVLPHALGMKVWFEAGEGPKLGALDKPAAVTMLEKADIHSHLAPVYETLDRLKTALPAETTLIGFCGAPWTVATYMLEGGGSKDFKTAKTWLYADPKGFDALLDLLVQKSADYLDAQIRAGAEVVQIFDSWAGALSPFGFERAVLEPLLALCRKIKAKHPDAPIILFPRGVHPHQLEHLVEKGTGLFDGLGLDTTQDMAWANRILQPQIAIQGNLDPIALYAPIDKVEKKVRHLLDTCGHEPGYIFNLGHGITPQTPIANVERLAETVRSFKAGAY